MSSTILPPRASADTLAALPAFPIDADVTESLRPTWIPIDPVIFVPPLKAKKKRSRAGLFALGALGAVGTWSLGFAAMLGVESVHDQYVKRAAAAAAAAEQAQSGDRAATAANGDVATKPASANPSTTKADDVILTVNVNDLPKSKDFKRKS